MSRMRFWLGVCLMLGTFAGHTAEGSAVLSIFKSRWWSAGKGGKVKGKLNLLKTDSLEA